MRYKLFDKEWRIIRPMLPIKPRAWMIDAS
jgi:transposase